MTPEPEKTRVKRVLTTEGMPEGMPAGAGTPAIAGLPTT
jgi:hypothetical protein